MQVIGHTISSITSCCMRWSIFSTWKLPSRFLCHTRKYSEFTEQLQYAHWLDLPSSAVRIHSGRLFPIHSVSECTGQNGPFRLNPSLNFRWVKRCWRQHLDTWGDKTGSVLRAWPHSNMHRSLKPRIKYHNSLKSTVNAAGWLHLLVYCYTVWCHVWHFLFPFKIRLYSQVKKGPRKDRRKEPSKQAPKTVGFQVNVCSAAKASHCVSTVLCISTNLYFGVLSLGE